MSKRLASFVVSGDDVKVVVAQVPADPNDPISIEYDQTWKLQSGDRGPALCMLHQRCASFLKEQQVAAVLMKASAASPLAKVTLALLHSAEVRGVVIAAAASVTEVKTMAKNVISRTYGERNVDEYVKDDSFWTAQTTGGKLRAGSREAAMLIVASRKA